MTIQPTRRGRGRRSCNSAEKGSVIVGQLWLFGLWPQDGELVAEHNDLTRSFERP